MSSFAEVWVTMLGLFYSIFRAISGDVLEISMVFVWPYFFIRPDDRGYFPGGCVFASVMYCLPHHCQSVLL